MYSHSQDEYRCPICPAIQGEENDSTLIRQSDIVYQDEQVTALVNSFFLTGNEGHVIVVPNQHHENIYDLPLETGHRIFDIIHKVTLAVRATYGCQGITIQQNNEPAGGQHAFHYHVHIYPRYDNDSLYQQMGQKRRTTAEERAPYASKLKAYLEKGVS